MSTQWDSDNLLKTLDLIKPGTDLLHDEWMPLAAAIDLLLKNRRFRRTLKRIPIRGRNKAQAITEQIVRLPREDREQLAILLYLCGIRAMGNDASAAVHKQGLRLTFHEDRC